MSDNQIENEFKFHFLNDASMDNNQSSNKNIISFLNNSNENFLDMNIIEDNYSTSQNKSNNILNNKHEDNTKITKTQILKNNDNILQLTDFPIHRNDNSVYYEEIKFDDDISDNNSNADNQQIISEKKEFYNQRKKSDFDVNLIPENLSNSSFHSNPENKSNSKNADNQFINTDFDIPQNNTFEINNMTNANINYFNIQTNPNIIQLNNNSNNFINYVTANQNVLSSNINLVYNKQFINNNTNQRIDKQINNEFINVNAQLWKQNIEKDTTSLYNNTQMNFGQDNNNQTKQEYISLSNALDKIIQNPNGCRYVQEKVKASPTYSNEIIFTSLSKDPKLINLICDQYGNYFFQTLLEVLNLKNIEMFLHIITKDFYILCTSQYGTRVLQNLIEIVSKHEHLQIILLNIMKPMNILNIIQDPHGNHIIQKYLQIIPNENFKDFIYIIIKNNFLNICNSKYGVCVVQKCLISNNKNKYKSSIEKLILDNLDKIINDQYGSYLIQFILTSDKVDLSSYHKLFDYIKANIEQICVKKYSANVIEKCFESNKEPIKTILGEFLVQNNMTIINLLLDKYGNYIIQKALDAAKGELYHKMIEITYNGIDEIKKASYGYNLLTKLMKKHKELKELIHKNNYNKQNDINPCINNMNYNYNDKCLDNNINFFKNNIMNYSNIPMINYMPRYIDNQKMINNNQLLMNNNQKIINPNKIGVNCNHMANPHLLLNNVPNIMNNMNNNKILLNNGTTMRINKEPGIINSQQLIVNKNPLMINNCIGYNNPNIFNSNVILFNNNSIYNNNFNGTYYNQYPLITNGQINYGNFQEDIGNIGINHYRNNNYSQRGY